MAEDVHTDAGRLKGFVVGRCGNSFMIASFFWQNKKQDYQLRVRVRRGVLDVKEGVCMG